MEITIKVRFVVDDPISRVKKIVNSKFTGLDEARALYLELASSEYEGLAIELLEYIRMWGSCIDERAKTKSWLETLPAKERREAKEHLERMKQRDIKALIDETRKVLHGYVAVQTMCTIDHFGVYSHTTKSWGKILRDENRRKAAMINGITGEDSERDGSAERRWVLENQCEFNLIRICEGHDIPGALDTLNEQRQILHRYLDAEAKEAGCRFWCENEFGEVEFLI